MSAELLSVRPAESDTTLVLKLSNPGTRNALHPDMYAAGIEAMNTAERDTSVRAIVLTGADNFFCAGGNLNRLLENRAKDPSVQAASIDMLGEWVFKRACADIGHFPGIAEGARSNQNRILQSKTSKSDGKIEHSGSGRVIVYV